MKVLKEAVLAACLAVASINAIGQPASNPTVTGNSIPVSTASGKITSYATGWAGTGVGVQTSAPIVNPGACQFSDFYLTDPADPANRMHQAALLTAYSLGRSVQISISGCTSSRPMITGVVVLPT